MKRTPPWIVEAFLVGMVLASLAGTFVAVIRIPARRPAPEPQAAVEVVPPSPEVVAAPAPPLQPPARPQPPPPPPKFDVAPLVADLERKVAENERAASTIASVRGALGLARRLTERAVPVLDELRRRHKQQRATQAQALVTMQVDRDAVLDEIAVLQRDRRAWQAKIDQERGRPRYAVAPYRGPNGTLMSPILIDCREDEVALLPDGPTFSRFDLSVGQVWGARTDPFAAAVRSAANSVTGGTPYVLFLVRPDGIRSYAEARGALETLNLAFGYELIDSDWVVEGSESNRPAIHSEPTSNRTLAQGSRPTPFRGTDTASLNRSHPWEGAAPAGPRGGMGVTVRDPVPSPGLGPPLQPPSASREGGITSASLSSPPSALAGEGRDGGLRSNDRPRSPGEEGTDSTTQREPRTTARNGLDPRRNSLAGSEGNSSARGSRPGHSGSGSGGGADVLDPASMPAVQMNLEIQLVCGPNGLLIHPGGVRMTRATLDAGNRDWLFYVRRLARTTQLSQPSLIVQPRLRFLVVPGGLAVYQTVRGQILSSGLDWPVAADFSGPEWPTGWNERGPGR